MIQLGIPLAEQAPNGVDGDYKLVECEPGWFCIDEMESKY
jgi:hypothetical protein